MINSVCGKTMEILRERISVKIVNNEKDYLKNTSKPTFIFSKILGNNYAGILEIKPILMLNKSLYVRLSGLEISKWLMYDFHYNFFKKVLMLNY